MSSNVIALLRVSSDAQAGPDKQGIPAQRETCESLAAIHQLNIVEWVELEGVSGAAVLAEPRFQRLLKRLADPSTSGVVAAAFDRVFRPSRFSDFAILDSFRDANAKIYTGAGVLDPATQNDALLGLITGHLAGAERDAIARRTRAGRERKRREKGVRAEGGVGMPRGVTFDQETQTWAYEYPAAELVRRAFRLFLSGETNLTEIGRKVGLGDRQSDAIRSLLRQPLYCGIYRVNRRWLGAGKWIPREPEECYEHVVMDPPLISVENFDRVQVRLAEVAGARPKIAALEDRPVDYPGFVYCARCSSRMMVLEDRRVAQWNYRCPKDRRARKEKCDLGQFAASKVDPIAGSALQAALSDPDTIIRLVGEGIERSNRNAPSGADLGRQLAKLSNRRSRLIDGYEMGSIDATDFRKRVASIDSERSAVTLQMEAVGPPEIDESACVDIAYAFARWSRLGRARRRRLLESFGVRFWIEKEGRGKTAYARVTRIEIGILSNAAIYKKIKRLGIE